MKKLAAVKYFPILCLLWVTGAFAQNNYSTNFPATENPISEGGRWINGFTPGLDWNNVQTANGTAFGVVNQSGAFNDPVAVLNSGTWATTQSASIVIALGSATAFKYPEIEVRLNQSISAHSESGYEFICSALNHLSPAGCSIVRHNGPVNDFTYLCNDADPNYKVPNGATITAKNTGGGSGNLLLYVNDVLRCSATDHTYTGGRPGIGFNAPFDGTNTAVYSNFAISSFTATDVPIASPACTGIIASNRAIDWRNAGFPGDTLPDASWPVCQTIAACTGSPAIITTALANCRAANPTGGVVVVLGAGTFNFNVTSQILFPSGSHVALRGAGLIRRISYSQVRRTAH